MNNKNASWKKFTDLKAATNNSSSTKKNQSHLNYYFLDFTPKENTYEYVLWDSFYCSSNKMTHCNVNSYEV